MICNFMIFLEYVGSRASLSAEEKQRTRELVHKELTLFYILKDWRFHKAFMRNPKRASLPNIMMNPILHSNFFLFTDMRIFCSITNSKKTGEFVFFRGFDEFFQIVFQKVCKFQFIYFCNRTVKNNLLWNLHGSREKLGGSELNVLSSRV